jgi:hypothetical protein
LPDAVQISLEPLALERLRSVMEAPNSLREALKADFRRVQSELGHRPSLVDIERRGRYPGRQYRMSFSTWLGAVEACGELTDRDRSLLSNKCIAFLKELEKTPMNRSYKMVVLDAMLASGRFQTSISLGELSAYFRQHFSKARYSRDIVGTGIADVMHVAASVLDAYVIANPINAWIGGNTTAPSPWFAYDAGTRTFDYIGPMAGDDAAFAEAIKERVDWRLETYLSRPGPGRNTYKVIPNGNTACIMLGNPSGDGLPRSGGWKVIKINGAFRYAKFARIAINWIAAEPDGDNLIAQELQNLLGSDLLEFKRPQRVMIAAESDSDCWLVSAL